MAQQTKPQNSNQPKRAKAASTAENVLPRLEAATNAACRAIADGGSSFARRARLAAKVGIPRATVQKCMEEGIMAAVKDANAMIERAYANPEARAGTRGRIKLS